MRLIILISFILFSCSSSDKSCLNKSDFGSVEWESSNRSLSYFICKDGETKMSSKDSFSLTFCGTINQKQILTKGAFDSLMFVGLYDIHDGRFSMADESLNSSMLKTLSQLQKNSIVYLKFQLSDSAFAVPDPKITVYFKSDVDSITANNWLRDKQAQFKEVLKTEYISKEKSKELFLKDGSEDWNNILDYNPLPSLADIFVRKDMSRNMKDSLMNSLLKDPLVSEVNSNDRSVLEKGNELLKTPFVIRVVTD